MRLTSSDKSDKTYFLFKILTMENWLKMLRFYFKIGNL
jgi:hypothetical protein